MKKIVLVVLMVVSPVYVQADFGSMINAVKSSPALTQQASIKDLMTKIQTISTAFSQMPSTTGKLDFLKSAMPLLTKANALGQSKPGDTAQIGGLLDQIKGLMGQKWSTTPLTAAQIPQATAQSQQFTGMLSSLLKNEGAALKGLIPTAVK